MKVVFILMTRYPYSWKKSQLFAHRRDLKITIIDSGLDPFRSIFFSKTLPVTLFFGMKLKPWKYNLFFFRIKKNMNIWIISTRNLSARVSKSVAVTARRLRATTSLDLSSTGASLVTLDRVSGISWLALAWIETPVLAAYIYRLQWPSLPRPPEQGEAA